MASQHTICMLIQCCFNIGPSFTTLAQSKHVGFTPCFYWELSCKAKRQYLLALQKQILPFGFSVQTRCARGRHTPMRNPNKHETLTQSWGNVGPPSTTSAHHYPNIVSTSRVCWHYSIMLANVIPRTSDHGLSSNFCLLDCVDHARLCVHIPT